MIRASILLFGLGTGLILQPLCAADWIGLEQPPYTYIGYAYRYYEDDSDSHRLYLLQQMTEAIKLQLDWNRQSLEDDSTRFDSERFDAHLDLTLSDSFSIGGGYRFEGDNNELEIEQYAVALSYAPLPLSLTLEARQGRLTIFTRNDLSLSQLPRRVNSDINVLYASLGWIGETWSAYLSAEEYDYQRDPSLLETRPLLQLLIKPGALANTGLLLQRQLGIGASWYRAQRELSADYTQGTSAIDDSISESLSFDWREYHDGFDLVYGLGYNIDSDQPWSIGFGIEWHA